MASLQEELRQSGCKYDEQMFRSLVVDCAGGRPASDPDVLSVVRLKSGCYQITPDMVERVLADFENSRKRPSQDDGLR